MRNFSKYKRFLFLIPLISVFLISYFFNDLKYLINNFFIENNVLQATTSPEYFSNFSRSTIDQYPQISYQDSGTVPFQDRFARYRSVASTTRFTHYLCSGNANNCSGYNQNAKFIRLRFDNSEKLVLYNYYGLYSVDEESNTFKWQSTHIDRFRVNNINSYSNCVYKFDPEIVLPVKDGNNFYLFSKFKGLNNNSCLQFFDNNTKGPSSSLASAELYLGYQVSSNGELNRNFNRAGSSYVNLNNQGPFGPGPQTAVTYSNSPLADVLGCKDFDSLNRCTKAGGLSSESYTYTQKTEKKIKGICTPIYKETTCPMLKCEAFTYTRACVSYEYISTGQQDCTTYCVDLGNGTSDCTNKKCVPIFTKECRIWGEAVPTGQRFYDILGNPNTTGAACSPNNHIRTSWVPCRIQTGQTCTPDKTVTTPSNFIAKVTSSTFSTLNNFQFDSKNWDIKGVDIPNDYKKYSAELEENSTSKPLNFTQEYSKSVFVTNKYLYKLTVSGRNLTIKRYSLNTSEYNIGGNSYISDSSSKSVTVGIKNTTNKNFSLDYVGDDILVMAAGSNNPAFYRIRNFNSGNTFSTVDLYPEVIKKLPSNTNGVLRTFGVVANGSSTKVFFVTTNQAFWTTVSSSVVTEPPVTSDLGYKNFEINGNTYSKEDLSSGFMFSPTSQKYQGNFVTPNNYSSNLKYFDESSLKFNYPESLLGGLLNFSNFTGSNFSKFNFMYENLDFIEPSPLEDGRYITLNPTSSNKFEIINISEGKGVKIDLTNTNIVKNFNKYILINSDKENSSRIYFYVDCTKATYSIICGGTRFNFKGSLLGQFYIDGKASNTIKDRRFIRIHENADTIVELSKEIRSKKYQNVSSTLIHLSYE